MKLLLAVFHFFSSYLGTVLLTYMASSYTEQDIQELDNLHLFSIN